MDKDRIMLRDCMVDSLIRLMDAKIKIEFYKDGFDDIIFEGYVYQLYDNEEVKSKLKDLYIYDIIINFDGLRVVCYDKWKKNK